MPEQEKHGDAKNQEERRSGRSDESTTVVRLLAFLLCSCFGVSAERVLQFCPSRPSAFVTSSGRGVMCG
ncbi:unnamed protein product [Brassica oleracea]